MYLAYDFLKLANLFSKDAELLFLRIIPQVNMHIKSSCICSFILSIFLLVIKAGKMVSNAQKRVAIYLASYIRPTFAV